MPPLNLIPLLFLRPLRLVLPSEDARRIRIVVLKATHAPFVAVIWTYERLMQAWARAASALALRGPNTPTRPLSSHVGIDRARENIKPRSARAGFSRVPQHASAHSRPRSVSTNADSTELLALVQALSTKVDDLAAMIAGQQS